FHDFRGSGLGAGANQSLQNLAGIEHRWLGAAGVVEPTGKCARWHLQRKQPMGSAFSGMARGFTASQTTKIVQRWNDVSGHLGIRIGISSQETIVRRDAAVGTLCMENPVNHRSQRVRGRNGGSRVRIEVPMLEGSSQSVRSEF